MLANCNKKMSEVYTVHVRDDPMDTNVFSGLPDAEPMDLDFQFFDTVIASEPLLPFAESVNDIISKFGLSVTLDLLDPYYTIYNSSNLILPSKKVLYKYISSFQKIFSNISILNDLFRIFKKINVSSVNGKIFVLQLRNNVGPKLLIKVPIDTASDPPIYEYYIGLALNQLRQNGIQHFSLVYGKFSCSLDPSLKQLCGGSGPNITHIAYEYIRTKSDRVMTLLDYIKTINVTPDETQVSLINIIISLMISLQHSQDLFHFTHYDLHLQNVLVIKLDSFYEFTGTYAGKEYTLLLNHFPFIIDYGRAHINPDTAVPSYSETEFKDDTREFNNFLDMQTHYWGNRKMRIKDDSDIRTHIYNVLKYNKVVNKYLVKKYRKEITVDLVLNNFYYDTSGHITHGISPTHFHEQFDFYRFIRLVCATVITYVSVDQRVDLWMHLDNKLQQMYPFYIPRHYNLPTSYPSFVDNGFEKPIDIANYLYNQVKNKDKKKSQPSQPSPDNLSVSWNQIGYGTYGTKKNEIKKAFFKIKAKMDKKTGLVKKIFKKLKEKSKKQNIKPIVPIDYSEALNETVAFDP